jgi:hypothetical protein
MPGRHAVQMRSLKALPAVITYWPAVHEAHGAQLAMLLAVLNVPEAHALQVRSLVEAPRPVTYCPASQSLHGLQLAALFEALNVADAHGEHARSLVLLPALLTKNPGEHCVHGTHALAGFASWSKVPGAQLSFGALPPAQYSPALHVLQTEGVVVVLGVDA